MVNQQLSENDKSLELMSPSSPHPCLWFNGNAFEAAQYYCSIFKNSSILSQNHFLVEFKLNGKLFKGLNAQNQFIFNEAISFVIECENQEEIDYYWDKLKEDGNEGMCGWLKDKYGISWQIVPKLLGEILKNPTLAQNAIKRMMFMRRFIIADLINED
jgi:predicted 3-demethylubiquinone-9 3-methyltransferase (glyoxalase superfamily)